MPKQLLKMMSLIAPMLIFAPINLFAKTAAAPSLAAGFSQPSTVTGNSSDGCNAVVSSSVTWSSSSAAVASIICSVSPQLRPLVSQQTRTHSVWFG
jgi:hypothetical protein